MANSYGYPHIGQLKEGDEVFDSFQRAILHPPNAVKLYETYWSGSGEAKISQNNRFMMLTDKKRYSFSAVVINGLGFGRQVKFNQITDKRTKLEFNIHLEYMHNTNVKAFVGLFTGTSILREIPNQNHRFCGVKVDTSNQNRLCLCSSNAEKEEITEINEFESIHYRLQIIWKNNNNVELYLYKEPDFKVLIGKHVSTAFASSQSAEIETFFIHWFVKTLDKEQKALLTKGWWVKAT